MLQLVDVGKKTLEKHEGVIDKEKVDEFRQLASPLGYLSAPRVGGAFREVGVLACVLASSLLISLVLFQ